MLFFLLSLLLSPFPAKIAQAACAPLFADVAAGQHDVATPESAAILDKMAKKLRSLEKSKDKTLAQIYRALSGEINSTVAAIEATKAAGCPQDETAELVDKYAAILEFPAEFVSALADNSNAGTGSVFDWNPRAFKKVDDALREHYGTSLLEKLPNYTKWYLNNQIRAKHGMTRDYLIGGVSPKEAGPFFFNYKYVFRKRHIPPMDFVKIREAGVVYIGVPGTIRADSDGDYGTTSDFIDHDYFHAYLQKYKDSLLFKKLGIKTTEQIGRFRKLSRAKVDELVAEHDAIKDPKLKLAVTYVLFGEMHEQALSYPVQVFDDLSSSKTRGTFDQAISRELAEGSYSGRKDPKLTKEEVKEYANQAILWVLERAQKHDKDLLRSWSTHE